jgi:hypothetical protein
MAIGRSNMENPDALFIVGNGSENGTDLANEMRSNAFEVISNTDGAAIKIGNVTLTEAKLQKLIDFIDAVELS